MLVSELVEEFVLEHKTRGSRAGTVDWYNRTLGLLLRTHWDLDRDALTRATITHLLAAGLERGINPNTAAMYDRCLRAFCTWARGVGYLEVDPFQGRKRPAVRWEPRLVLTPVELDSLFHAAQDEKAYKERHRAILSLFVGLGLRAAEVARLRVSDVDWDAATLRIDGKTGYAVLPLDKSTHRQLRRYVTHERKSSGPALFVHQGQPLTAHSLSRLINRLGKRAGITRPIGPHLLRHTFATLYLKAGGDTFTLQRLLRHATAAMTTRYLHYQTDDLRSKLEALSPLRGVGNR